MTSAPTRLKCSAIMLLLGLLATVAQASTINWSSSRFENNFNSRGEPLTNAYQFELGAFEVGFIPTSENVQEWGDHWTQAQRAEYNEAFGFFAASYNVPSHDPPFQTSSQGYIWGYNEKEGDGAEWILVSDTSWSWPNASGLVLPVTWSVSGVSTVVVGEVDGDGFHMKTDAVSLNPGGPLTPDAWLAANFAGQPAEVSDWNADPDQDGYANLIEYGLGLDPNQRNHESRLHCEVVEVDVGRFLQLKAEKTETAGLVNWIAEVSDSAPLEEWVAGSASVTVVENSATAYVARDGVALSGKGPRFLRLRAFLN